MGRVQLFPSVVLHWESWKDEKSVGLKICGVGWWGNENERGRGLDYKATIVLVFVARIWTFFVLFLKADNSSYPWALNEARYRWLSFLFCLSLCLSFDESSIKPHDVKLLGFLIPSVAACFCCW